MSEAMSSIPRLGMRSRKNGSSPAPASAAGNVLPEDLFVKTLGLERKRTERSGRRFVLMLLESAMFEAGGDGAALGKVLRTLVHSTRETDVKGWYKSGRVLGVIFTEVEGADGKGIAEALLARVTNALSGVLREEEINQIKLSFHAYPEEPDGNGHGGHADRVLYPDLDAGEEEKGIARAAKRAMDVAGSLFGLVVLSPLLIAIAIGVKLTSKGPVLFRQQRVGLYGREFTFLKFRSMYVANDDTVHKQYVKALIAGSRSTANGNGVYKLTDDQRITPLGKWLRRTSLDELPQLLNVLRGEMSLVGPRPAIPYEVESYDTWHRRRVLAVKPGITGLWQVEGRSRVTFDEMIRLDLRYAAGWSLWLDVKILLRTPRAVVLGAY